MKRLLLTALVCLISVSAFGQFTEIPDTVYFEYFPPTATVHNGELYVFFKPYTYVKSTDGTTWSAPVAVPFGGLEGSCGTVANAISYNGRLYVFMECVNVYYTSTDGSGTWAPVKSIPGANAGDQPGLAVFNNRLYAMWRAWPPNTSLFYASMDVNETWSATARLSTGESGDSPSAAVINSNGTNYMYSFWRDRYASTDAQSMWYSRMGPTNQWSSTTRLNTPDFPLTTHAPAASTGTDIYIAYKGGYNNDLLYKKLGTNLQWQPEVTVATNATQTSPALAYFGGQMRVFYRSPSSFKVRFRILN